MTKLCNLVSKQTFEDRYPQLSFLLTLDHEPFNLESTSVVNAIHEKSLDSVYDTDTAFNELNEFEDLVNQADNVDCIVVFGLGLGLFFEKAKTWLLQSSKRDLVFIENQIWKIKAFLKTDLSSEFFSHPQVHLRYIMDSEKLESAFDEITLDFPVESVLVTGLNSYKKTCNFPDVKEQYLRRSIITSSLYKEGFFSDRLFENFFPNYLQLLHSRNIEGLKGQLNGMPAVICGAGPSLDESIEYLKELKGRALIIAGGSTITALSRKGVEVDIGFAVDPNEEEYERLKQSQSFQTPLLFATRVYPEIFRFFNGELGYFRTCTGGAFERAVEETLHIENEPFHMGMKDEGLSVTVLCLAAAIAMGCSPIFLVGVDLAYVDNKCYADKVTLDNDMNSAEKLGRDLKLSKINTLGNTVQTTLKWVMESEVMSHFSKLHENIKVYDCVSKGLGFEGIEKLEPKDIISKCKGSYDIKALVHQKLTNLCHLSKYKEDLFAYLEELKMSFATCLDLANQVITRASSVESENVEEDPLISLYLIEIEEEIADKYFLSFLRESIDDYFIERYLRVTGRESYFLEKWKYIRASITSYLSTISSYAKIT